ncbi:type II toxin-antitoxin system HipA family toxin [Mycoavidus sp. SF9855]|uniref:type II toxin-antitoxin system HipA family toxin n=1 Tax=Mycoavidus sp. SF9855 TaxID=2968475 RepID=UPI00211B9E0B|nr:type II toxin-antitoxin system HipA family toxin [Mycoavidus sp. SF9855]UUM22222.1 type II toxin-antitoxin system HipA family toxin [Mycoavidus sp. SF9855]
MKKSQPSLKVWLDDPAFGALQIIGTLHKVGHDGARFTYDKEWLKSPVVFQLDPALTLDSGDFYPVNSNFGVFMDSCPDRWGQVLMQRRETIEAKEAGRTKITLRAWEFLCGVQDHTRMGALRFSTEGSEGFLANELLAAPPIASLAELQHVALELSRKKIDDMTKLRQWLKILVAPGASLGGARPKANLSEAGDLWIAKFPAADDDKDAALWEKLLHDMASACGINVPPSRVQRLGHAYHTFMVKRFDRENGARRFFTSAMTLLNKTDQEPATYLDLAQFISEQGSPAYIGDDLRELFVRVAFNITMANRDDHLRNHGFIRTPSGWRLSPAYDMNPSVKKDEHVLGIDEGIHEPSLEALLETAIYYKLSNMDASLLIQKVFAVVATWKVRAKALGIAAADVHEMEHLFITDEG